MPADVGGEGGVLGAEVFLSPEVADCLGSGDAKVGPFHGDVDGHFAAVDQTDGFGAVFEIAGPDFLAVTQIGNATGGFAEGILIDREDFIVG